MSKEVERFYLVWDIGEGVAVGDFDNLAEAEKDASDKARANLGNTFVVFEPKSAFRAAATVSPVYLSWPVREAPDQPQ